MKFSRPPIHKHTYTPTPTFNNKATVYTRVHIDMGVEEGKCILWNAQFSTGATISYEQKSYAHTVIVDMMSQFPERTLLLRQDIIFLPQWEPLSLMYKHHKQSFCLSAYYKDECENCCCITETRIVNLNASHIVHIIR